MDKLVDHLFEEMKPQLNEPYAFYGHSMGTVLGYLLVKRIMDTDLPKPAHLFFTGCEGPSTFKYDERRHTLPKDELIHELKKMGGGSEELFNNDHLMDFFEPILRADFEAIEKYRHQRDQLLEVPISVFIGTEEDISLEDAKAWQEETTKEVTVKQFPGDHFFIFDHEEIIMKLIFRTCLNKSVDI